MQKNWIIKPEADTTILEHLQNTLNVSRPIANLLAQRGINNYENAKRFFRPCLDDLYDPFLMKDMEIAVERISTAINNNESVMVYGDYDVDGTTSVSMMYSFLKSRVKNLLFYIPDRDTEGYGISYKGIDFAHQNGCSLIIALDCGIKSIPKVDYGRQRNIDFIIVDHHEPGAQLPAAVAILDPKRDDCNYPFKELSACGVGFKLIQAYSLRNGIAFRYIQEYLDLVVVSIASDIVPIIDENRIMAYYGLKQLNSNPRNGLKAIIEVAGLNPGNLKISDLVFKIGPRINAAGRIELGKQAVELLIATDECKLPQLADRIDCDNTERKFFDTTITKEALQIINENPALINRKTTVVYREHWHKGVIGIVASRLIDYYYRPTIVLTKSNGMVTGSARSVPGFNIYKAIDKCQHLLVTFGGHMYAAGLTIKEENVEAFADAFEAAVAEDILPENEVQKIEIDAVISFNNISDNFFNILEQFEPYGPGNMSPVFASVNVNDTGFAQRVGPENEHLRMYLTDASAGKSFAAIGFKLAGFYDIIKNKNLFDVCYSIEANNYRGKKSIQIKVRDIQVSNT